MSDLWGRLSGELQYRQRSGEARSSVEKAMHHMRGSANPDALWEAFSTGLESLGLDSARFDLFEVSGVKACLLTWPGDEKADVNQEVPGADCWSARFRVQSNGHLFGELELRKTVQECSLLADAPELVDRLRKEMAVQLERMLVSDAGAGASQ